MMWKAPILRGQRHHDRHREGKGSIERRVDDHDRPSAGLFGANDRGEVRHPHLPRPDFRLTSHRPVVIGARSGSYAAR
jgi:hypothetical protein